MKRRTLDVMFSVGGLFLAGLLLVMGMVLASNANFAKNYTHDQLLAQGIKFKTADTLTAEEKAQPCLVKYAGQALATGKQAECYANHFIGPKRNGPHAVGNLYCQTHARTRIRQLPLKNRFAGCKRI